MLNDNVKKRLEFSVRTYGSRCLDAGLGPKQVIDHFINDLERVCTELMPHKVEQVRSDVSNIITNRTEAEQLVVAILGLM